MKKTVAIIALLLFWGALLVRAQEEKTVAWPGPERKNLEIPGELWGKALEKVGFADRVLGYTAAEMDNFGGDDYPLKFVKKLFQDVAALPRVSGAKTDYLLENREDSSKIANLAYRMLGTYAASRFTVADAREWGLDWIPKDAPPDKALELILAYSRGRGVEKTMDDENREQWEKLPGGAKRFVVKMLIASIISAPMIKQSFDTDFLARSLGVTDLNRVAPGRLHDFASAPWADETEICPRASFDALGRIDMSYLAFGSIVYLRYTHAAINEFKKWRADNELQLDGFSKCLFETATGKAAVYGKGADEIRGDYALVVDFGGDDRYTAARPYPALLTRPSA